MPVEGEKTDSKLMARLLSIYGIGESHEIISYNTNIYTLYNRMFADGEPETVDVLQVLKEHEVDGNRRRIFDYRYSDILLIFDLDPQAPDFTPEKISAMASYFTESSDMGKLYLNYPMVEAFYHMKSIPDDSYNTYTASLEELYNKKYKERVSRENRDRDYRKFAATKDECTTVIKQNIAKAWFVCGEKEKDGYILPDLTSVLTCQLKSLAVSRRVSVLCTCVFYIADYNYGLLF